MEMDPNTDRLYFFDIFWFINEASFLAKSDRYFATNDYFL